MIISKRALAERFRRAYWSVPAQRHLHQAVDTAARDPEYARQQIDVLLSFVLDCALSGEAPPSWVANSEPPPKADERPA